MGLESWRPAYLDWWQDMGPDSTQNDAVYLRTVVNVGARGWAHFGYVKMPEYREASSSLSPTPAARSRSAITQASPFSRTHRASSACNCDA